LWNIERRLVYAKKRDDLVLLIERSETLRRSAAADWETKEVGKFADLFGRWFGRFASFAATMARACGKAGIHFGNSEVRYVPTARVWESGFL
jgi:hypothetical protein